MVLTPGVAFSFKYLRLIKIIFPVSLSFDLNYAQTSISNNCKKVQLTY
jgi:hypothetical protein